MDKHCDTCICGRRAPVQATVRRMISPEYLPGWGDRPDKGPGTVTWAEHLEAYAGYAACYGQSQTAERMAERGGFSYYELIQYMGHEPKTWEPRR